MLIEIGEVIFEKGLPCDRADGKLLDQLSVDLVLPDVTVAVELNEPRHVRLFSDVPEHG